MGRVNVDDVAGIQEENGKVICVECLDGGEHKGWQDNVTEDNLLMRHDVDKNADEEWLFCDECKKKL
ncbi:MAG TPA: hypothetical protein VKF36_16630 [Syntrophorhabdales bacterium]|nr:hypothetical protein [Syntrophorhabdales bacterium]